jgi:hypothetical protein
MTHAASGALGFAIGVAVCGGVFLMVEKPSAKALPNPSKFYLVADPTTTGSIMLQVVREP